MVAATVDVHAHVLSREAVDLIGREVPQAGLKLTPANDGGDVLEAGRVTYKGFPRGAWDMEMRLTDMARAGVAMQLLSNTPLTFLYDIDPDANVAAAAIQNDFIATHVKDYPTHFYGIGTLPLQAPERAAAELRRIMTTLGLSGAQIGTNVNGRNLDDPALDPVWRAADELEALIMVHPNHVAAAERLGSYYLSNLIGNPLEITIAAASLVFGGVVARYPSIRFLLVHGGGFVPYQIGRLMHGWQVRPEPKTRLREPPDAGLRGLWFDTITHSKEPLEFLISSWGASQVVLGSDYPYDMGTLECVRQVEALAIDKIDKITILSEGPRRLIRKS